MQKWFETDNRDRRNTKKIAGESLRKIQNNNSSNRSEESGGSEQREKEIGTERDREKQFHGSKII